MSTRPVSKRARGLALAVAAAACAPTRDVPGPLTVIRDTDVSALIGTDALTSLQYDASGDILVLGGTRPLRLPRTGGRSPEVLEALERELGSGADVVRLERIGEDTLLMVARGAERLTLWHADRPAGDAALPPAVSVLDATVADWPARVFALALRRSDRELLLLRATGDRMVIDTSVALHGRSSLKHPNLVTLGNAVQGGVWLAQSRPDELSRIAVDGTITARWVWRPEWTAHFTFPASPDPFIAALHEDAERRLWLFWRVARRGTGPALIDASRGVQIEDRRRLFDTVVEVLDPDEGRVLARGRVAAHVLNLLPDGRVVLYRRGGAADGTVGVYRFSVP
ncbi:MAG TPA: hypothetical protein VFZ69_08960 [Longimicrobiales bacterium]